MLAAVPARMPMDIDLPLRNKSLQRVLSLALPVSGASAYDEDLIIDLSSISKIRTEKGGTVRSGPLI